MGKVGDREQLLKKKLNQWFFKISNFSEELLNDLDDLNQWPEKVKMCKKIGLGNHLM